MTLKIPVEKHTELINKYLSGMSSIKLAYEVSALFRAKKSLSDFLALNNDEKKVSQIIKKFFMPP